MAQVPETHSTMTNVKLGPRGSESDVSSGAGCLPSTVVGREIHDSMGPSNTQSPVEPLTTSFSHASRPGGLSSKRIAFRWGSAMSPASHFTWSVWQPSLHDLQGQVPATGHVAMLLLRIRLGH